MHGTHCAVDDALQRRGAVDEGPREPRCGHGRKNGLDALPKDGRVVAATLLQCRCGKEESNRHSSRREIGGQTNNGEPS